MKKLALLLTALGVMSATAFAEQPTLKVDYIGQEIEVENTSGDENIGELFWFFNNVGLSYGNDWTFGLQAGKTWGADTDDGFHSNAKDGSRLQLDVWRKFDGYKLGFRYRGHKQYDRYYGRVDWSHGIFWGAADIFYESNTETKASNDSWKGEIFPIGLQYNGFKIGWFIDAQEVTGGIAKGEKEDYYQHQIRFYAPLYKGEKLTSNFEYRMTLTYDESYKDGKQHAEVKDFGRHRVYIKNNYKVKDNLDVFLNLGYQTSKYESVEGKNANTESDKYWSYVNVGWKYTF